MPGHVIGSDGRIKDRTGVAPQGVMFSAFVNADVSVANAASIIFNGKNYDSHGWFNTTTGRFTPQLAGYYRFNWRVRFNSSASGWNVCTLRKNGAGQHEGQFMTAGALLYANVGSGVVYLNGTTDYVDLAPYRSDSAATTIGGGAYNHSVLEGQLIGVTAGVVPEPWHIVGAAGEPAFTNSWTHYDQPGGRILKFMKDPGGTVFISGIAKSGSIGGVPVFTLPVGYRPGQILSFTKASAGGIASEMQINSAGQVMNTSGANGFFYMDCSFRAEN
jgi:hypothetical protein